MTGSPAGVTSAAEPALRPDAPQAGRWWVRDLRGQLTGRFPAAWAERLLPATWLVSGAMLGIAVALVFRWSAPALLVAAVATGLLSWLGRGVATVLLAVAVTLAGLSVAFRTTMLAFPHQSWSLHWLAPLSVLLMVAAVLAARRLGVADWRGVRSAAVALELASSGGALLVAAVCMHRMAHLVAASVLVSREDNDAWLNTVGTLHDAHGATAATTTLVPTFGPVIGLFLSFVRSATGGLLPGRVLASQTAVAVVAAHITLAVLCPVVAGLMARRTVRHGRPGLVLLTWATLSGLLVSYALILPAYGFLSAMLSMLLLLTAACLIPSLATDLEQLRPAVKWLAAALVIYAAGSAWVPLVPMAGIVLFVWYAGLALRSLANGPWARVRLAAVLGVPTLLCGVALLNQYRDVISPIGGSDVLLSAGGGTPAATEALIAGTAVVVALAWLANGLDAPGRRRVSASFSTPLLWLVGYVAILMLGEAWETKAAPHYGSIKLLYVVVGMALALGVADVMGSAVIGTRRLDAAAAIVVAVLFVGTADQGPMYAASQGHWPVAAPTPGWVPAVTAAVAGNARVLCLGTTAKQDDTGVNLDAYTCSRYASSLQGRDDATALTWRFVQLNRLPVAQAVKALAQAKDRPWTIVVIGSMAGLQQAKAWWAPIVKQGGLTFVQGPPG